jgi:nucleotide-binding universal stress UspA family protein
MSGRRPLDAVSERLAAVRRRLGRIERRERSELRRWIQNTANLLHLSVVVFVPLVLAAVTYLSNQVQTLSFLLFPPLAAGAYTLFSDPEGRYADPVRFVASLSTGAVCGLASYTAVVVAYGGVPTGVIRPESAALAVFLTGIVTWAAGIESPSAFSTALLALVTGEVDPVTYVVSVAVATTFVAAVFTVWRERFYGRRAEYLYETVRGDDHVLVPMRGETAVQAAFFGARLAAAHDAGKVVLLDIVDDAADSDAASGPPVGNDEGTTAAGDGAPSGSDASSQIRATDSAETPGGIDPHRRDDDVDGGSTDGSLSPTTAETVARLEECAESIRTQVGVPCEVAVVAGSPVGATIGAARTANCDLVVVPDGEGGSTPSTYLTGIFAGPIDAIAFRSGSDRRRWRRVLVLVARPGDTAHGMIDFATRLAGTGTVSVTTCIGAESERRTAESRLERLVETAAGAIETRVARSSVESFVAENAGSYDLIVLGSSGERSPASRLVSPPTYERLRDADCDVAVFNRGVE